jgi:hypothetical protein
MLSLSSRRVARDLAFFSSITGKISRLWLEMTVAQLFRRPWEGKALLQNLLEKIVAFVIHKDKRRKVFHFDPPDRLHAELGIFEDLDFFDILFRQDRRRSADRP